MSIMRPNRKITILIALAILITAIPCLADESQDYVLLLKQSPVDSGTVSQQTTEHGLISISASPKNGYQFIYWLGDVADSTSPSTTVTTDSPKLVIAVYERTDFEASSIPGANRGVIVESRATPNRGGSAPSQTVGVAPSAPGAKRYSTPSYGFSDITDINDDEDFNPDFPVPDEEIPEPATIGLFAMAGWIMTRKRKNRR